ncbi:MAG: Ser-Thr-rich GPI-anchored membrane family protein, partial [Candidatus Omnitrophota bacterium]
EYSSDNFISNVNTITSSVANTGTYSWAPTSTGTTYTIRVSDAQDSQTSDVSDNYFTVTGIGVTAPASGVTWNCGSSHSITWNYTGTFNYVKIEYYNGSSWVTVTNSVANTGSYAWTIPNTPANTAQVRISDASDGDPVGTSSVFNIKSVLTLSAPNGAEELNAGDATNITWTNTGTVNNVKLEYYNGSSWVTIIESMANTNPTSGGSYSWTVPTTLTSLAKVRVSDVDSGHPTSNDESDTVFTIKAGFSLTSPASAVNWAVNEAHNITWTNTATVSHVRLYYATEVDSYAAWTEITSGATANTNTYSWTVSDAILAVSRDPQDNPILAVKVKVVDSTSGNPASSVVSSAFNVLYYTITFSVKDSETSFDLSSLSVACSSGWSASSRTSGVNANHNYPYGSYVTVWSRANYNDASVSWVADSSKTISVALTSSTADVIVYHVYSNFTYDALSEAFKINSWLEKTGKVVGNPVNCTITIYDKDGQTVQILSSSSPDANGVFRTVWDITAPGLDAGSSYFAKVEIRSLGGNTYSSHVVYSFTLPQTVELSAIGTRVSAIQDSVGSGLGTNVSTIQASVGSSLGTNVSTIQTSVGSSLGSNVSAIQSSVGSGLGVKVDNLQTDVNLLKTAVGATENTTLYSSVGTLISEIGTGNISSIKSNTDSLIGQGLGSLSTNVSAIKAKTDNINWDDIGSIKTKTDTVAWTDIAGIKTKTDAINWSDVTTVKSNLSTLSTTVDTLAAKIDTINTNVTSIKSIAGTTSDTVSASTIYGKLQGAASSASSVSDGWSGRTAADIIGYIDNLENYLGTPNDAAGQNTAFGKIASLSTVAGNVDTVKSYLGTPNDAAGQRTVFGNIADVSANTGEIASVYTAATNAYTEAQDLRDELAFEGKSDSAYGMANALKGSVEEIKEKLDEAMNKLGDTQINEVVASVEEAKDALKQAAQATGAQAALREAARPAASANNLESLRDEVTEIKAMLQAVKAIVEKQEEPVVKSSFGNE